LPVGGADGRPARPQSTLPWLIGTALPSFADADVEPPGGANPAMVTLQATAQGGYKAGGAVETKYAGRIVQRFDTPGGGRVERVWGVEAWQPRGANYTWAGL
jgi:hypothetical protein